MANSIAFALECSGLPMDLMPSLRIKNSEKHKHGTIVANTAANIEIGVLLK
ncbi:hypothetical protein [Rhizobium ecuadorense]|uniref:hypothetical protein n=1 Tax=Rhizobium ecuadorense TaxID=1671795 RepID=UPI000A4E96AF|nr:hypothetical protein [Rhizobium ecuadorense]